MQRVDEVYGKQGLVVVTVAIDPDPQRTVMPLLRERGARLAVTPDPGGTFQQRLGVWGHPSFVFVDRSGDVVGTAVGYRDWGSAAGQAFLEEFTGAGAR